MAFVYIVQLHKRFLLQSCRRISCNEKHLVQINDNTYCMNVHSRLAATFCRSCCALIHIIVSMLGSKPWRTPNGVSPVCHHPLFWLHTIRTNVGVHRHTHTHTHTHVHTRTGIVVLELVQNLKLLKFRMRGCVFVN